MESLYYNLICIIVTLIVGSKGYCLYGDGLDCVFPCHCANKAECTTGCQPTGCATGPLDIPWQGPGCQIGNVALDKQANQTGGFPGWTAPKGVDGRLPVGEGNEVDVCAHPRIDESAGQLAEWGVDLGDIYNISSIIIYNRLNTCCRQRTTMFTIGIRNSSNYEELCYDDNSTSPLDYKISLTCYKPVIGRYIRFARKQEAVEKLVMNFCEFIAIGHRYLDCSMLQCDAGTGCSEVTGCEQCTGSYQPDCLTPCEAGFYGTNCQKICGHCAANDACNKTTGYCPNGCQQWSAGQRCQDNIVAPLFHNESVFVDETSSSSIHMTWQPVSIPSQLSQYYGYTVFYRNSSEPNYTQGPDVPHSKNTLAIAEYTQGPDVPHSTNTQATITGLVYNTEYHIEIRPYREMMGQREYGQVNLELKVKTACGVPDSAEIELLETVYGEDNTDHGINVIFSPLSSLNSRCDYISDILVQYRLENELSYSSISTNLTATSVMIPNLQEGAYVVRITVINNGNLTSTSKLSYLTLGTTQVPIITTTMAGRIEEPNDKGKDTVIIASVVAVVVVMAVVVSVTVVILLRRRRKQKEDDSVHLGDNSEQTNAPDINLPTTDGNKEDKADAVSEAEVEVSVDAIYENAASIPRAVPLSQFVDYVKECMSRKDYLGDEYKTLPAAVNSRCITAQTDDNKKKNRFLNIYPYDETRVVLETDHEDSGDYINANYITGYTDTKEYIATQGPRGATVVDLWRMIWQEKSNRIVMVANLDEMGKVRCQQYWPKVVGVTEDLGSFLVTMETEEIYADYTTRMFTIKKAKETRTVRHFHFTTWPDKSRPMFGAISLFAFYRKVHAFNTYKSGPLIVHCSAGVGRTGTFIALDILMQQAKTENRLDIYGWVKKLRKDRMFMVQTQDQYLFLHDALVDFLKFGDTAYNCDSFERTFIGLSKPQADKQGRNKLQQQFMMIQDMKSSANSSGNSGLQENNRSKNRNPRIIADDMNRPYLSGRENYINAVYVDTFKAHDAILVTQMPLPNTVSDFWRLVCDQESHTIIMLNELDSSDQTCQPYWPQEEGASLEFGKITIKLLKENQDNSVKFIKTRDMEVKRTHHTLKNDEPDETVIRLRHFQLMSWPSDSVLPPNPGDLLDLMDLVQHWQQTRQSEEIQNEGAYKARPKQTELRGKTIIHCLDGGSASGLYCAVSHTLDRMKVEQEVDAFLAARCITRSRPQFINTEAEYKFLYKMASQCMSRFTEYANFQ